MKRHSKLETMAMYYGIEDEMKRDAVNEIDGDLSVVRPANDNDSPTPESHTKRRKRGG